MIAWIEDEAFGLSLSSWPREDPVLVVVKYGLSNGSLLVRWCSEYRSAGGHFADLLERRNSSSTDSPVRLAFQAKPAHNPEHCLGCHSLAELAKQTHVYMPMPAPIRAS